MKYSKSDLQKKINKMRVLDGKDAKGNVKTASILSKNAIVYATEDGQVFDEKGRNAAYNHARTARCEVLEFRGEKKSPESTKEQIAEKALKDVYLELTGEEAGDISFSTLVSKVEKVQKDIRTGAVKAYNPDAGKKSKSATPVKKLEPTYTDEEFDALKKEWDDLSGGKAINKLTKYPKLLEKVEELRKAAKPEEGKTDNTEGGDKESAPEETETK